MDAKTRELVAVAASVAGGCQDCLRHHVAQARRYGATDSELGEAMDIAKAIRLTVAMGMDALGAELLGSPELAMVPAGGGCACGPDCDCQKGA
jgi:AhpD family alkylhydroperoxidase